MIDDLLAELGHVVSEGLDEAASLIAAEAWRHAPEKTGTLGKSMRIARRGRYVREIYPTATYASFVENGRGPVFAKPGKVLRFEINGVIFFRKSVGPAAPRPYMAPARDWAEANAPKIVQAHVDRLLARLAA